MLMLEQLFIVTGATSGVGKLLTQIIYAHNAKVHLAARSVFKAEETIVELHKRTLDSKGQAKFIRLDLEDLSTIKVLAEDFLSQENRLDVLLWNDAGAMAPPQCSMTKQGHEQQLAARAPASTVRTVWVVSSTTARFAPKNGVELSNLDCTTDKFAWQKYGTSKAGNILHTREYAHRHRGDNIISVSLDLGNLKTDLYRHIPRWQRPIISLVLKDPIEGAYTELFAGLSPGLTMKDTGEWIDPGGYVRTHKRADIELAGKRKSEGGSGSGSGSGSGEEFWSWSEQQVQSYA